MEIVGSTWKLTAGEILSVNDEGEADAETMWRSNNKRWKEAAKETEMFRDGCITVNNIMETKGGEFYRWNVSSSLIFYTDVILFPQNIHIIHCFSSFLNESNIQENHKKENWTILEMMSLSPSSTIHLVHDHGQDTWLMWSYVKLKE